MGQNFFISYHFKIYAILFFFLKVLDVYCAFACLEHLEHLEFNRDWMKQVMKLQVPIEVVCSEQTLKQYSERSREMAKYIQ